MCRWMVYFGSEEVLIADVLTRPTHSLITQCYEHHLPEIEKNWSLSKLENLKRVNHQLNGDGFGVGWYVREEISLEPCVFVCASPPWNNRNLLRLSEKTVTRCLFAHVRAASPGSFISEANCHPFQFGRYLFMHNGGIPGFFKIKVALLSRLSERTLAMIAGTTDTEHIGALFIEFLGKKDLVNEEATIDEMRVALLRTIDFITSFHKTMHRSGQEVTEDLSSSLNLAVTDGCKLVATRYRNHPTDFPPSLYYNVSRSVELVSHRPGRDGGLAAPGSFSSLPNINHDGRHLRLLPHTTSTSAVEDERKVCFIASEPLTYNSKEWKLVPPNHILSFDLNSSDIHLAPIYAGTIVAKCYHRWREYRRKTANPNPSVAPPAIL